MAVKWIDFSPINALLLFMSCPQAYVEHFLLPSRDLGRIGLASIESDLFMLLFLCVQEMAEMAQRIGHKVIDSLDCFLFSSMTE